ncbi:YbbR-like domain-containing protein [soil metagenome]
MKSIFSKASKSNLFNRRAITFFFCLLISVFIWLLMSLSKEYVITTSFPVKYINLPEDRIIANHLPEVIDIEIKSTGFNLLVYKIKLQRETVLIDIKDAKSAGSKNNYYISCNKRLDKITSQFSAAIKVTRVNPDTIFINYNKKMSKMVPVKVNLNIDYDEQYQQTDSIRVEPSFVEIAGTAESLAKITFVETAAMNLKKVDKSLSLKLDLLKGSSFKQIEYSQNTVQVKVNVTKFTEAMLELPVEVENVPSGLSLKTFPDKISVKYQVAYDDYGKVSASDCRSGVDYSKIEAGSKKLKVVLLKSPASVRSIKLSNEKVEYIIRK